MSPRFLVLLTVLGGTIGAFVAPLAAQDEMFDDPGALETEAVPEVEGQSQRFLETDTRVGGRFWAGFSSEWDSGPQREFTNDLGADFTLDSRPSHDYRVFSKVRLEAPFDTAQVRELFADFTAGPAFFRVGKQSIKAGVGPFFSPADALSLEAVDPEDPDAERTGPIAAKARLAWGTTNLSVAAITEGATRPDDVGAWVQAEAVWGTTEVSLSGFLRRHQGWRVASTVTTPLGGVNLFAEAAVIGDNSKSFVQPAPGQGYDLDQLDLVASWTAGWRTTFDEVGLTWTVQYYFNGLGTDDSPEFARTLARQGVLSADDLKDWGRHQAATSVFMDNIASTGLDAGLVWTANLGDASGRVSPRLSWTAPGEPVTVAFDIPWLYGPEGSEYAPEGSSWALGLEISLGDGKF